MGRYKEGRAPSGNPTDGERDVWFAAGEVKFGHYVSASDTWIVDSAISGGEGDWHVVGASGEPAFQNGFTAVPELKFRNSYGKLEIGGEAAPDSYEHASMTVFTLPEGFRPASTVIVKNLNYTGEYSADRWTVTPDGQLKADLNASFPGVCDFPGWDGNAISI
jgi:hypothetical protein